MIGAILILVGKVPRMENSKEFEEGVVAEAMNLDYYKSETICPYPKGLGNNQRCDWWKGLVRTRVNKLLKKLGMSQL